MGNGYWDFLDKNYKDNKNSQQTKENCEKSRISCADKKISSSSFLKETIIESDDFQEQYELENPDEIDISRKFVKHHLRKNLKQLQINISIIIFVIASYNSNKKNEVLSFYNEIVKDINFATLDLCDSPATVERLFQSSDMIYKKVNGFLRKCCIENLENDEQMDEQIFDLAQTIANDINKARNIGSGERGNRDFRFIDI